MVFSPPDQLFSNQFLFIFLKVLRLLTILGANRVSSKGEGRSYNFQIKLCEKRSALSGCPVVDERNISKSGKFRNFLLPELWLLFREIFWGKLPNSYRLKRIAGAHLVWRMMTYDIVSDDHCDVTKGIWKSEVSQWRGDSQVYWMQQIIQSSFSYEDSLADTG